MRGRHHTEAGNFPLRCTKRCRKAEVSSAGKWNKDDKMVLYERRGRNLGQGLW